MDDVIDFLGGFLVGAAIGGVVGLLLAPQSGSDLQQKMRERAQVVMEEGRRVPLPTGVRSWKRSSPNRSRLSGSRSRGIVC